MYRVMTAANGRCTPLAAALACLLSTAAAPRTLDGAAEFKGVGAEASGANRPVIVQGELTQTTVSFGSVMVSVVDAIGFSPGTHGQRLRDIFLANTNNARLVQIEGEATYELNGETWSGINSRGYTRHALERGAGIFWSASHSISFLYTPEWEHKWFVENGRPFGREERAFAGWMQHQNVLLIVSVENSTAVSPNGRHPFHAIYCDDFEPDAWWHDLAFSRGWYALCGGTADYIAHSGVGLDKVVFVGALNDRNSASSAIRSDGVFAPHTIYVASADGSTSQATPVLAAYATNLASSNPTWSARRLKRELMELAVYETLEHENGTTNERGTNITDTRTIKVIRPENAPSMDGGDPQPPGSCEPNAETLCLQDGRYEVRVEWRTVGGESGAGKAAGAGTADSGLFYFFEADNWEILVKVLDGCTVNGHHWVFAASATDLGLDLTVRDTQTGKAPRHYTKDPGEPAPAITDVAAFPEGCQP